MPAFVFTAEAQTGTDKSLVSSSVCPVLSVVKPRPSKVEGFTTENTEKGFPTCLCGEGGDRDFLRFAKTTAASPPSAPLDTGVKSHHAKRNERVGGRGAPRVKTDYSNPCLTIARRTNAIWVASGSFFGHTSWQASSDMQPNTPSSSPTSS